MISQIGNDLSSVNFWSVTLAGDQAIQLRASDHVAAVVPLANGSVIDIDDSTKLPSRPVSEPPKIRARAYDPGFATQLHAQEELVMISQPQIGSGGSPLPLLNDEYVYDKSAGDGAVVYVVDTGADPMHQEFVHLQRNWRWSGPSFRQNSNGDYIGPPLLGDWSSGHRTAMLSKIGGYILGVSKKVQSIIVRMPDLHTVDDVIVAITWVINDWIRSRDRQSVKVAIINLSLNYNKGPHFKTSELIEQMEILRLKDLLNIAVGQGLLPISSAGNRPGHFGGYPAMFAGLNNWDPFFNEGADFTSPPVPELLIVGATDADGKIWNESATGESVAFAPGADVYCAIPEEIPGIQFAKGSGTSYATAVVSGLAAYYAALPSFNSRWNTDTTWYERVIDLKRKLIITSYSREKGQQGYPDVVWNGVTRVGRVCGIAPPLYRKRDEGEYCNSTHGSSKTTAPSTSTVSSMSAATSMSASTSSGSATMPVPVQAVQRQTNVQVSRNSVFVGDLSGLELFNMVVSKLTDQCPAAIGPNATCNSSPGAATIEDIGFVSHEDLETGKLEFTFNNSNYSTTAERDGKPYHQDCSLKREILDTVPHKCEKANLTTCTATDGVYVEITDGEDGVVAFMDVAIKFDVPGDDFFCDKVMSGLEGALATVPELRVFEKELISITAACQAIEESVQGYPGGDSAPP